MLSSGSREHLCSPLVVLPWRWLFAVRVYWRLVSLPCPLSLGQDHWSVSQFLVVSMLWCFTVCFSILQSHLTLDVAHWLRWWALWTAVCPISGSGWSLALCGPSCLSSHLFTDGPCGDQFLAPPCLFNELSTSCPLCCVFSVHCLLLSFFCGQGQSAQGAMLAYLRGGWGNTTWHLTFTCLVCQMSLKQIWSWQLAVMATLLFSQCNVVGWSFLWDRSSGCQSFDSPWCFISAKCSSSVSARFWSHGAHTVCFCALVTILDQKSCL
jgi:hypothetical protein